MQSNKAKYILVALLLCITHILLASSAIQESYSKDSSAIRLIKRMYSNIQQLHVDSNWVNINNALENARLKSDRKVEADIYNLIGDYYNRNFTSDSMLKYYKKAFEVGVKVDYNLYFSDLGYKIANTYWDIGNYSLSLEMALQLKSYYEGAGLIEEQAHLINLLGIIYLRLLDYPAALENLQHSARISERKKNFALLGVTYTNMANAYFKIGQYLQAKEYYEKGVRLEVENKEYRSAGRSYESMANMYMELNEEGKVEPLLKQALEYNALAKDMVGLLRTYSTYAKFLNVLKKYSNAVEYLTKAEDLAIKTDSKEYYMNTCEQYSIAYQNLKDYKRALHYQNKYVDFYRQIYDIQTFAGIKKLEHELRIEKKNNEISKIELEKKRYINVLLIIVVVLSIAIGSLFMVMYFRSVSTKRSLIKMNSEIHRQKEELERANIELEEARKVAEGADELKSHFLRNITHEIRTPLNGIVGLSEVIVNMNEPSVNKKECLQMIKNNSSKLISTIDNLVEMAHITSNQVRAQLEQINPKHFIDDIYQSFLPRFDLCNGKVEFNNLSKQEVNIHIRTDAKLLRKIVEQLIENSIKFTKEGSISIGYKLDEGFLHFFVQDTGVGISKDSETIIFESFRQEQEGSIREFEGVGIGLTIAKKLSELLGAELWFESKKDKGTIFYISFRHELT